MLNALLNGVVFFFASQLQGDGKLDFHLSLETRCNTLASDSVKEVRLTNDEAQDRYASYDPTGRYILFESDRSGNWDIFLLNKFEGKVVNLTSHVGSDRRPCWHPNGEKILFESDRSGVFTLYEMEISSRKTSRLKLENTNDATPIFARYSPDGKYITVSLQHDESHSEIHIFTEQGKSTRQLTQFGLRSYFPNWSPNGKYVVFFSRYETDNSDDNIYLMPSSGGFPRRLVYGPTHEFCPEISPDNQKVVYAVSQTDGRPEIFISDLSGENQRRITYNEVTDTLPSWSPDGSSLLITTYRHGHYDIYEIILE